MLEPTDESSSTCSSPSFNVGLRSDSASCGDQQNGSLNAAASAQVNWSISCEQEGNVRSARLAFQIEGLTKGRKFTLKAEAQKDGLSVSTIDLKPADKSRALLPMI